MAVDLSGIKIDLSEPDTVPAFSGVEKEVDLSGLQLDLGVDVSSVGQSDLLDNDEVDTLDFVFEGLPKTAKAALGQSMAAIVAESGRRMEQASNPLKGMAKKDIELLGKDPSSLTVLETVDQAATGLKAAAGVMAGVPDMLASKIVGMFGYDVVEKGKELQEEAAGVLSEVRKDQADVQKMVGDSWGRQAVVDAVASTTTTLPATLIGLTTKSPTLALSLFATAEAVNETQNAVEKGAGWNDARAAGLRSGLIEGAMESVPLKMLLEIPGAENWVKKAGKFLVAEVGTEVATTALQQLNEIVSYNPDMTIGEYVEGLARTALSAPLGAGMQVGIAKTYDGIERGVKKLAERGEAQDTPIVATDLGEEYFQAGQKVKQTGEEVEKLRGLLDSVVTEITERGVELNRQLDDSGALDRIDNWLAQADHNDRKWLNRAVRPLAAGRSQEVWADPDYRMERGGQEVTAETIQPGQVVTAIPQPVQASIAEKVLASPQATEVQKEEAKRLIARSEELAKEYGAKAKTAAKVVESWIKKYTPDMKVLLTPKGKIGPLNGKGFGFHARTDDGTQIISVNADQHEADTLVPEMGNQFAETLAHEYGHALIAHTFEHQELGVQQALVAEWKDFHARLDDMTVEQFLTEALGPGYGKGAKGGLSEATLATKLLEIEGIAEESQVRPYVSRSFISFQEWLANQMSKKEAAGRTTQKYFAETKEVLHKFFQGERRVFAPSKTFDLYLKKLSTGAKLERAIKSHDRATRHYQTALRNAQRTAATSIVPIVSGSGNTNVPGMGRPPFPGLSPRGSAARKSIDKFNWLVKYTAGLEHIAKLNRHIPGAQAYYKHAQAMWQEKMRWTERASQTVKDWVGGEYVKGEKRRQAFSDFMFAVDRKSEEVGRKLTDQELVLLRSKFGVTEKELALSKKIWGDFEAALTEVEEALVGDLTSRLVSGDTVQISRQIQEIRQDFSKMRNRHYMPHSRFGRYTVTAYAQTSFKDKEGRTWKQGETVLFEAHASEKEAAEAKARLDKEYAGKATVGVGELQDEVRELLDMPPQLAEMLRSRLELTAEQEKQLRDIQYILMPGQGFRKKLVERKSTPGYSKDSLRVYADYMQKFSGHLARIKHGQKMQEAVSQMRTSATVLRQVGQNTVKRERIVSWYQEHLDYMMNPGNELSHLRAMGFVWYLGFLPKAAMVNLTQPFVVSLPYLSEQYSEVAATGALSRAMYQVMKAPFMKGHSYSPEVADLFDQLTKRGTIDGGLATELAALSEGGVLGRLLEGGKTGNPETALRVQQVFEASALMFQAAEKFNRRIVAHAAYSLGRKNGLDHAAAVEAADRAVVDTQFEYGRINRPQMMRGKVGSSVFMFWQYVTNMLWFMGLNKKAGARALGVLLLVGGAEGLPFASNILDLLDYGMRKLGEVAGWKDPKKGARDYLAELFNFLEDETGVSARMMQKGAASDLFGVWDLSSSLSMGRIIPGTDKLASSSSPQNAALGALGDGAGALINIPLSLMSALASDSPDDWKTWELAMPNFAKGISQTVRWAVRGEETDRTGSTIHKFEVPTDYKDALAVYGRAVGLTPSTLTSKKEAMFRSKDAQTYYANRHKGLTDHLNYALHVGDEEMMGEVLKQIEKFNAAVPYPEMMIQSRNLVQSLRAGQEKRAMREQGLPDQLKFYNLDLEYKERYGKGY